jgi:putative glutamine amidotransferase
VDPALYGQTPNPAAGVKSSRPLDDLEMPLLRLALDRDLPVLAICRGMQLLNVAFGGTLIQDLPDHRATHGNGRWESAYHQTYLAPGTRIAAVLGIGGFFRLNSRHHQGLREAQKSPALLASAYSLGDGIIEALESPAHRWVLGVQSHPEREDETPRAFARLFQRLVERAELEQG